ncbi:MAG: acetyl-CoA carboxylase biotin carboxyl carrier protein subunit [Bacteroidales bacterium]|jgi:biotin carboxyl carrier protein|nr:acetyl-CoA carboxylase biotin carboxyl carrier protein subunit [Bacteroidales bacterium]
MAFKKTKVKKTTTSNINEDAKTRLSTISTVHGKNYKTFLTEKYKNRKKWEKPDFRKILSVIPGTVVKIHVKEGQEVKEGDLVMILEAMKMLNKIYCPMDGIVKKIYISDEEKVPKGHLMIELT